jgi:hypothetical protein
VEWREKMSLVYLKNKKNEITYVYESENYWDKEKQQSRSRRTCIGKLDPHTGELIASKRLLAENALVKPGPIATTEAKRLYYGATYFFNALGEKLGITADLKQCFPDHYKQMLSIAYFLILEAVNPFPEMGCHS